MTHETKKIQIQVKLNGVSRTFHTYPMERLLTVLREEATLTGTKEGCGEGECGACSILMDGLLVNSCLIPALQANGKEVITIEGLQPDRESVLHPMQAAFMECGGAQCGICTPGMILAAVSLLKTNPSPSDEEIRTGLAGNLCRCTGYMKIVDSVRKAATLGTLT